MHDLTLTAMYADEVIMMRKGELFAQGPPADVINSENVSELYDCRVDVNQVPV